MRRKLYQRERVLLHLARFRVESTDFGYYAPWEVTQDGIAEALGIGRNNVPRLLKRLIEEGLVGERKAHVRGAKHVRKVYYLTPLGLRHAAKLKEENKD